MTDDISTTASSLSDTPLPPPRPNVPIRSGEETVEHWSKGSRYASREIMLSRLAGAEQFHVNLSVLPPGKHSCPFHYHMREEEHFFVTEGRCVLRSGEARHEMGAGDYVCFPAGSGVAHTFENPFDEDCTMLTIGQEDPHEIAVFPDSNKAKLRSLDAIVRWPQQQLDYWDDEPID